MSEKNKSFRNLLKNDVEWLWDENCYQAYTILITTISNVPVLSHYDEKLPLLLSVDSSRSLNTK